MEAVVGNKMEASPAFVTAAQKAQAVKTAKQTKENPAGCHVAAHAGFWIWLQASGYFISIPDGAANIADLSGIAQVVDFSIIVFQFIKQ